MQAMQAKQAGSGGFKPPPATQGVRGLAKSSGAIRSAILEDQ